MSLLGVGGGAALARARLARGRTALLAALSFAFVLAATAVERRLTVAGAVDRALIGSTFGIALPLFAFAATSLGVSGSRLGDAAWPVARFGAARGEVALGLVGATALFVALLAAGLAAATAAAGHGPGAPPLLEDVATSAWIGALGGATYVAYFAAGSTWLSRGRGRHLVLALDFLVGGSTGTAGALLPRAHLRNLLGGEPPLRLEHPTSSALLAGGAVLLVWLAVLRARR